MATKRKPATAGADSKAAPVTDRAAFLAITAPRIETVPLPHGRGTVRLRSLTASELLTLPEDTNLYAAALVARAVIDADGKRLFGDTDDDLAAVQAMDGECLTALSTRVMTMNLQTKEAAEGLEKN